VARADEMMKALLKNSPDSIFFKDLSGKFVAVSETKAANSETTVEGMIGKTDFDFLPQEQAEQVSQDDRMIIETGESIIDKIEKLTRPDGTEVWISASKAPWKDESGEIIGVMGISRDISNRMAIEKHIKDMLAIATHDIRGPLTYIGSTLKLLMKGRFTDSSVALRDIYARTRHLEKVVNEYLCKSSMMDMDGGLPDKKSLDLRQDIIDPVLEEFSGEIEQKNLLIDNTLGAIAGNEIIIEGHAVWLRIVYRNLIANSIKFLDPGGKIAFGFEDWGDRFRLNVFDSGVGVPEEKRDKIFERFTSEDSMGLGLPICRDLIRKHGGEMWYENTAHNHPNFCFTLPK
jgi:PAS domain S-box-containing protein